MNVCEHVDHRGRHCRKPPHLDPFHAYQEPAARQVIRPVSRRRSGELREYRKLRRDFLAEHPRCAFPPGCAFPATTVQHLRGRRGARLLDVKWWAPSCMPHNEWAESHSGEALAMGWLVRIEGGDAA